MSNVLTVLSTEASLFVRKFIRKSPNVPVILGIVLTRCNSVTSGTVESPYWFHRCCRTLLCFDPVDLSEHFSEP